MITSITFMSEAAALALRPDARTALISITEPTRLSPLVDADGWGALLRAQFLDAEYDAGMLERLAARGDRFDPDAKGFPSERSVSPLRAFLVDLRHRPDIHTLVIHCHAGRRRSTAVARYAAELFDCQVAQPYDDWNRVVYELLLDPARYSAFEHLHRRAGLRAWIKGFMV